MTTRFGEVTTSPPEKREEEEEMNNPYDLHTWSNHYHEQMLRGACTRRLEGRLQAKGDVGAFRPHEEQSTANRAAEASFLSPYAQGAGV
jgi:hypothetical protein